MSKILVTGGTGYIGSHTVVELHNAGYTPVIVDNLSNSNIQILNQIEKIITVRPELYQFELSDERQKKSFVPENRIITSIINLAASKAVGEYVEKPLKYYHHNFFSLINLLAAYQGKPINFVFSFSCTVYGEP